MIQVYDTLTLSRDDLKELSAILAILNKDQLERLQKIDKNAFSFYVSLTRKTWDIIEKDWD